MPYYADRRSMPPCPDSDRYILVQTKEGYCWRRKRGQKTPVTKNATIQANEDLMKQCSPAAKRLLDALWPYRQELETGRIQAPFTGLMRKGVKGRYFSYTPFKGVELQKAYPLGSLLKCPVEVTQAGYSVVVQMPIKPAHVHRHSPLVSDFYLEAVLISGDPLAGLPLKVESTTSPLYAYENMPSTTCNLQLPLSEKPWILLLKFCSLEGNELATHAKHYAMKVIEVGG